MAHTARVFTWNIRFVIFALTLKSKKHGKLSKVCLGSEPAGIPRCGRPAESLAHSPSALHCDLHSCVCHRFSTAPPPSLLNNLSNVYRLPSTSARQEDKPQSIGQIRLSLQGAAFQQGRQVTNTYRNKQVDTDESCEGNKQVKSQWTTEEALYLLLKGEGRASTKYKVSEKPKGAMWL